MKLFLFAAALISLTITTSVRAALIQLQAHGTVTTSTNLPSLVGQQWTLTLIYDTEAPDQALGDPGFGGYLNTSTPAVIQQLDLTVGGYAIHLVKPVPTQFAFAVRLDIDNFSPTDKTFFAHVEDPALLPSWDGQQINNFTLMLLDGTGLGYADGTDALPTNPMLTLANFTNSGLFLHFSSGDFQGPLTDLSFAIVSELSVVLPSPPLPPKIAITGKKNLTTSKAKLTVKGKAPQATLVTVKVGKASARPAVGTSYWRFNAKLKLGTNKIRITAIGPGGVSTAKMTIFRE